MNKKGFRLWKVILLLLILAAALFLWIRLRQNPPVEITRTYQENDTAYDNPARGGYIQVQVNEYDRYRAMEQDGIRLALLAFDIMKYSDQDIPEEKLETLRQNLEEAKKCHIKIIFRAAYGFWGECQEPSEKEGFAGHIKQISQILNQFKDTVISVQAGMLGPYGEWHHGDYLSEESGSEEANTEIRRYILSQWEQCLDASIPVAVRRPRFIREAQDAGILIGRLGYHNDGLLGSESDLGTYDDPKYDRMAELNWMRGELESQINGGEMPGVSDWNDPDNADGEFADMHITYLNLMYNTEVLDKWEGLEYKGQNAKQYISNHLGYRLSIQEVTANDYWKKGPFQFTLRLKNSGYAALPKRYKLYVILTGNGLTASQELKQEELYRISCGEWAEFSVNMEISEQFLQTKDETHWEIGIKIADSLEQDQEKEWIKLANDGLKSDAGVYEVLKYSKDKKLYWLK